MSDKRLTNAQLIAELQKMDPDAPVEVAIRTYTKRYPVAYLSPFVSGSRINVTFPEGYAVHKRRGAVDVGV